VAGAASFHRRRRRVDRYKGGVIFRSCRAWKVQARPTRCASLSTRRFAKSFVFRREPGGAGTRIDVSPHDVRLAGASAGAQAGRVVRPRPWYRGSAAAAWTALPRFCRRNRSACEIRSTCLLRTDRRLGVASAPARSGAPPGRRWFAFDLDGAPPGVDATGARLRYTPWVWGQCHRGHGRPGIGTMPGAPTLPSREGRKSGGKTNPLAGGVL